MKNIYQIGFTGSMLLLSIIVSSCGQNPKIKTITIVNGDTTISEGEFNEKEFAEMGKHIEISMTGDGDGSEKRIKRSSSVMRTKRTRRIVNQQTTMIKKSAKFR